jgi:hypothetical protein
MSFVEATSTTMAGLSAVFLILIPAIQEFIILVMLLLLASVLGAIFILPAIYAILFNLKTAREARSRMGTSDGENISKPGHDTYGIMEAEELVEDDSDLYGT